MTANRVGIFLLLALGLAALLPGAAGAHGDQVLPAKPEEEQRLREIERETIGPEHAREHALAREAARRRAARVRALSPAARRDWARGERAEEARALSSARAAVPGTPDQIGSWSERYGLPDYVMHAALLRTGEVAMWGWLPYGQDFRRPLRGENWFWDTSRPLPGLTDPRPGPAGSLTQNDAPQVPIGGATQTPPLYCSGVSFLPDGRLVIAGGNLAFTEEDPGSGKGWKGLNTIFVYDPATKRWSRGPLMEHGRWYPTQVMLSDGRTWIGGGYDENGYEGYVQDAELLDEAAGSLTSVPPPSTAAFDDVWGAAGWPGLYPHAWVMPGGRLMIVPREWSRASALFDPATATYRPDGLNPWTARPEREGATAVLLPDAAGPSHTAMQTGGFPYFSSDGQTPDGLARTDVRTIDDRELTGLAPWTLRAPLNIGRSYHNTVLLPGGGIVTVGGGAGNDPDPNPETTSGLYWDGGDKAELLTTELFDPASGTWKLGAPQRSFRAYHSVALLLPDGRVWSAGDDWHQDETREATGSPWRGNAEIYSPPYLFGATDPATGAYDPSRPAVRTEITAAPPRLAWGEEIDLATSADDVSRMVLVAPAAVTHSIDTNQRHVALDITGRGARSVRVRLPGDATTAPPGWYMLFALNGRGTPSHADWVRVGPAPGPASPPPAAPGPASPPSAAPVGVQPFAGEPRPQLDRPRPRTRRRVSIASLRVTRRTLLKRRRVDLTVRAGDPGRVVVRLRLLRARRNALFLGARSVVFRRAGRREVSLRLSRTELRALRAGGRMTLLVKATALPGGGRDLAAAVARRTL